MKNEVRSEAFAFYDAPASLDEISRNDSGDYKFLRRCIYLIAQTAYIFSSNVAAANNRFSRVGAHSILLTIQSVRMGLKFDGFPYELFFYFKLLAY